MRDYARLIEQRKIDVQELETLRRGTWICAWIGAIGLIVVLMVR